MDERSLFFAWAGGDRKAGEVLFHRYYEPLLRYFHNKVSDGAAADLVQTTFVSCLSAKDRYRGDASARTFLFGIAHHVLHRHYRSLKRRRVDLSAAVAPDGGEDDDVGEARAADLAPSASSLHRAKEEQRLVLEALRRLPLDCQEVLELHYWEELDTTSMAEILGVPSGTVKSRLQRGRRLLEREIAALEASPAVLESTLTRLDDWARGVRDRLLPPGAERSAHTPNSGT